MDPNEALKNARAALAALRTRLDDGEEPTSDTDAEVADHAGDLADAFEALDGWLSKGGFLPAAWQR